MGALNTIGVVITIGLAIVGLGLVGLMAVTGIGKVKQDTDDLLRMKSIERETQEASWAIHQRASAAFTAMLAEARPGGGGTDDATDKSNKSDWD